MITPFTNITAPIQSVTASWIPAHVRVSILRADLVDPLVSGNKYYKLLHNISQAQALGHDTLLSFGGAWSNHLHALAAAGHRYGLRTIGIVRGDPGTELNPCLQDLQQWGMTLKFVTREQYRSKHEDATLEALQRELGPCFIIPEGGANRNGVLGCRELLPSQLPADMSHILLACGTGTTMAGLLTRTTLPVYGIQAMKGQSYLQQEVARLLEVYQLAVQSRQWKVFDQFHRGGFGKADAALLAFINNFAEETGIPLEPVYSGKLLMAVQILLEQGTFPAGSHLLLIHGGGLQGRRGYTGLNTMLTGVL